MPEVQTGASMAIDFLSGFGKGMAQADVNRRENEKLDMQKQKWQQEMTAYAAQDELRKMQLQNSQLEIDMRKTQFDDIVASREQTKGFVAFMADAIGKVKGSPAEKQSQLLEAYMVGGTQFSQADRSIGDKMIDIYSKIHQSSAPKAWKIEDIKDFETGKKRQAIIGEHGEFIKYMPGDAENLDIVNETITKGIDMQQEEYNTLMQSFIAGKSAVLGAEGQSLNLDDFMKSIEGEDDKTKSEMTMDWIFEVQERLWAMVHEKSGTLDTRLGRMLTPFVGDVKMREALVKPYAKISHTKEIAATIEEYPLDERAQVFAAMGVELETLLPEYEMGPVRMELMRLQNKTALEMKKRDGNQGRKQGNEERSMANQVADSKKLKEENLLRKFATGVEGLQVGPKVTSPDWWANFLGQESGDPEAEAKREMLNDWNKMQKQFNK